MTRFYILRHGNTFDPGEPPRRIGAATDLPLSESGVAQAHALGAHLAALGISPSNIVTSPLRRTMTTALVVAAALSFPAPPESASWLIEIDHGLDEGRLESDVLTRVGPAALEAWEQDAVPPPGWRVDVAARVSAWRAFLSTSFAGDVVAVTSNGMTRLALVAIGASCQSPKLRTGAFGVIEQLTKGRWRLRQWDHRPDL